MPHESLLPPPPRNALPEIVTVSRLNQQVRMTLSSSFPLLWVEGEISNLARPTSGHLYFTLKDAGAQVRCAMFKSRNLGLRVRPENGMQVLVRARVGLYERRGEFQLTVERMEKAGQGALQLAFEALKQKLDAEGLFDSGLKKSLPAFPHQLGIVTSPTGAAIRDILSILGRRFPALPILIYPVPVQGEQAPGAIIQALHQADRRQECDVLILARGGGSLEDLWAFNDENVARAIAACKIPLISGVGHEIDFTIADFVADQRAPTPSAAAELISPDRNELLSKLSSHLKLIERLMRNQLEHLRQQLKWLQGRLGQQHPRQRMQQQSQRLDELERRLHQAIHNGFQSKTAHLNTLTALLQQRTPRVRLVQTQAHHGQLQKRLYSAMAQLLKDRSHRLATQVQSLHAISPLATLSRGYAIVTRQSDQAIVRTHDDVRSGSKIHIQLAQDRLAAIITDGAVDSMVKTPD